MRGFWYKGIRQKSAQTAGQILDHSALSSGSFGTGKSWGLEAVKVDAERDNEMFRQCAPPTSDRQLCVTLTHAHARTNTLYMKWATGITEKTVLAVVQTQTLDTNQVQYTTQTPLAQQDTFFFGEWPSSITMSRTTPEIWRYSHLLVDYF